MYNPFLSVVIPAYNEAKRLPATLEDINKFLSKKKYQYEILVVSDGSSDDTAAVVKNLEGKIKNLKLIDNRENLGKGAAVRQGMLAAAGKYRLFMDADNSVTIDQIENFLPWFEKSYDLVIGSIEIPGAEVHERAAWYRRLLGKASKSIIHLFLGIKVRDTQRGFKCFADYVVEPVFCRQTIFRWGFDFEILYVADRLGFKIKEVPVKWNNPGESKVKLSGYVSTFRELLKVRRNAFTGRYNLS